MKLFVPCTPSGHFSTQLGPSLKWKHLVQWSGPYVERRNTEYPHFCFCWRSPRATERHQVSVIFDTGCNTHIALRLMLGFFIKTDHCYTLLDSIFSSFQPMQNLHGNMHSFSIVFPLRFELEPETPRFKSILSTICLGVDFGRVIDS